MKHSKPPLGPSEPTPATPAQPSSASPVAPHARPQDLDLAAHSPPERDPGRSGGGSSDRPVPGAPLPYRVVLDPEAVGRAATRLAHEIVERNPALDSLALVAIAAGGIPVARLIADRLEQITGRRFPIGELDVTLYRDDVIGRGKRPVPHRTRMLPSVAGSRVVLIDDVMFTGRTVRAAMDAVIDFGRPEAISVACLVDRGHRELPIHVDFVGKNIPTQRGEQVSVVELSPETFEVRVA